MRPAHRPGARRWLLLPAAVLPLVLSGLAAGCSSTPSYCTAATNLKTSVSNLGDVDVAKNGLNSLQTALTSVTNNANTFASEAKSAFPSQTTALQNSVSGLDSAVKSAKGEPALTAVSAVVSAVTQVKNSASSLQSAISSKCS
jgi:hypothetical protein